ncbi:MAG: hypothetical protein ABWX69_09830 [Arthrobacter sp.]
MTIAGAASTARTADPGAGEEAADDAAPAPHPGRRPGPVPGADANRGRLNAPPFSWLGSDAWPSFPLWADEAAGRAHGSQAAAVRDDAGFVSEVKPEPTAGMGPGSRV